MVDVPAALSLLLANLVIVVGVLALLTTLDRLDIGSTPSGDCHVCSATADATVTGQPVCEACKDEYFRTVQ